MINGMRYRKMRRNPSRDVSEPKSVWDECRYWLTSGQVLDMEEPELLGSAAEDARFLRK